MYAPKIKPLSIKSKKLSHHNNATMLPGHIQFWFTSRKHAIQYMRR